jgi:hypothetical protein
MTLEQRFPINVKRFGGVGDELDNSENTRSPKYAYMAVRMHPSGNSFRPPSDWTQAMPPGSDRTSISKGIRELALGSRLFSLPIGSGNRMDYRIVLSELMNYLTLAHMIHLDEKHFNYLHNRRALATVFNAAAGAYAVKPWPKLDGNHPRMLLLIDEVIRPYQTQRLVHTEFEAGLIFVPQAVAFMLDVN